MCMYTSLFNSTQLFNSKEIWRLVQNCLIDDKSFSPTQIVVSILLQVFQQFKITRHFKEVLYNIIMVDFRLYKRIFVRNVINKFAIHWLLWLLCKTVILHYFFYYQIALQRPTWINSLFLPLRKFLCFWWRRFY